ncbi:MAG: hypothetical protein P4M14_13240 [Gammaproteobacteria bacterium]|nr:hypothetical protein [Gammaproteobacteria bacterium]
MALYNAIKASNLYQPCEKDPKIFLALINLNGHAEFYVESNFEINKLKSQYTAEQHLSVRYQISVNKDATIKYRLEQMTFDPHYHSYSVGIDSEKIDDPQVKKFHEETLAPLLVKAPSCAF